MGKIYRCVSVLLFFLCGNTFGMLDSIAMIDYLDGYRYADKKPLYEAYKNGKMSAKDFLGGLDSIKKQNAYVVQKLLSEFSSALTLSQIIGSTHVFNSILDRCNVPSNSALRRFGWLQWTTVLDSIAGVKWPDTNSGTLPWLTQNFKDMKKGGGEEEIDRVVWLPYANQDIFLLFGSNRTLENYNGIIGGTHPNRSLSENMVKNAYGQDAYMFDDIFSVVLSPRILTYNTAYDLPLYSLCVYDPHFNEEITTLLSVTNVGNYANSMIVFEGAGYLEGVPFAVVDNNETQTAENKRVAQNSEKTLHFQFKPQAMAYPDALKGKASGTSIEVAVPTLLTLSRLDKNGALQNIYSNASDDGHSTLHNVPGDGHRARFSDSAAYQLPMTKNEMCQNNGRVEVFFFHVLYKGNGLSGMSQSGIIVLLDGQAKQGWEHALKTKPSVYDKLYAVLKLPGMGSERDALLSTLLGVDQHTIALNKETEMKANKAVTRK